MYTGEAFYISYPNAFDGIYTHWRKRHKLFRIRPVHPIKIWPNHNISPTFPMSLKKPGISLTKPIPSGPSGSCEVAINSPHWRTPWSQVVDLLQIPWRICPRPRLGNAHHFVRRGKNLNPWKTSGTLLGTNRAGWEYPPWMKMYLLFKMMGFSVLC